MQCYAVSNVELNTRRRYKWKYFPRYWPFVSNSSGRPVALSFGVLGDVRLNKLLSKQARSRRFVMPWCSLWRDFNVTGSTRSFGVFLDVHLNEQLSRWFDTPWRSLWGNCNKSRSPSDFACQAKTKRKSLNIIYTWKVDKCNSTTQPPSSVELKIPLACLLKLIHHVLHKILLKHLYQLRFMLASVKSRVLSR